MNELIKELREWAKKCGLEDEPEIEDTEKAFQDFDEILSRHSAEVEPLAVLANKKGARIGGISLQRDGWVINIDLPHIYDCECVVSPTYAAAEAKARAYLEGLDDVREGKK